MELSTLHIYPARNSGWDTPDVYTIIVRPPETVGDAVRRLVLSDQLVPMSRDRVFDMIAHPLIKRAFADIEVHADILHPAL